MTKIINPKTGMPFAHSQFSAPMGAGSNKPMDAFILPRKMIADNASIEATLDHGFAQSGVQIHIDNMVGNLFKLKYLPLATRLGLNRDELKPFIQDVNDWWSEISEDPRGFIDAEEKRTFTMIMRECAGTHTRQGEWMAQPLFKERRHTSLRTCIKIINPNRVCNPNFAMDTARLRGGVGMTSSGAPRFYHVQRPNYNGIGLHDWVTIPAFNRIGRRMFLHIFEPQGDGQTRAATQFISIIKRLGSLDKFQDTALENAIINAMLAVSIESDADPQQVFELISSSNGNEKLADWASSVAAFHSEQQGLNMGRGTRATHLLPGESLNVQRLTLDGAGLQDFERSILRYIAAGLNISYEQLAKDYSQVSYSSARAALNETWRYMMGRRKVIVSRAASEIFQLCFEDALDSGELRLPKKATRGFYEARHAWTNAEWIGTGRLAIDELKEAKAAAERLAAGLSTLEDELALLGKDYETWLIQRRQEIEDTAHLRVKPYIDNAPTTEPREGNSERRDQ